MKVADLIEKLKTMPPDARVVWPSGDDSYLLEIDQVELLQADSKRNGYDYAGSVELS